MAQYKPVLDKKAAEAMNLTVLRRLDPAVDELLATAGHVALYDFDIPTKKWSRKDVEGSLFLVKRRTQPRFQFIILNKKSADNFVEDVMGSFQCEVNKPYLLYRNKAGEVVGIWFYDDAECDRISALLMRIATTFAAPSSAAIGSAAGAAAAAPLPGPAPAAQALQAPPHAAAAYGGGGVAGAEAAAAAPPAGGDDGFWDRQVEVPAELDMPQMSAQGSNTYASPHQQPPQQLQHAAQDASSGAAQPDNSLARIFAGMKMSAQPQQAPQQGPRAAAAPSSQVLPLLSPTAASQLGSAPEPSPTAAPAAPAQPTPQGAMPLLTPQFLRQQVAAPAAPQQQQQQPAPAVAEGAGQALLNQLQGRPASRPAPATAAGPVPLPVPVAATAEAPPAAAAPAAAAPAGHAGPAGGVDLNEAAERVLHGKVKSFLRGLAENDLFVDAVTAELRRAGIL